MSTWAHAVKVEEVSRVGGSLLHSSILHLGLLPILPTSTWVHWGFDHSESEPVFPLHSAPVFCPLVTHPETSENLWAELRFLWSPGILYLSEPCGVVTVGCCGHAVPGPSVACFLLSFLCEWVLNHYSCPHLARAESRNVLKKWVVRLVVKETGCQACEKLSPGERVCWEVVFSQRESSTNYRTLRIPDPACCWDPEREVKHRWVVLVKVYNPGWNRHVGNDSPWVVGVRRLLERILLVALCIFPVTSA